MHGGSLVQAGLRTAVAAAAGKRMPHAAQKMMGLIEGGQYPVLAGRHTTLTSWRER
eukprot:CAMPEP_0181213264 /NCGR_PEP_ID=MMETSP1096-20121128/24807_1 /TAXON_ID=156174 ORGANISM="Chrysochromulina ericina, Strain CCMP281" /NCGR_SAMPLE_ID=MMETSP1096 /ASSEMBLY_ACC=CAM_ASM_000453 /LENGTH=55 /DNA_ID=CAMNT_0023304881 /DNA_START=220 /DNA_END=387 /DNA_ORIENTATION=+